MIFPSLPRPHNWAGVRRLGRGAALALSTVVVLGSACRAPAQPPVDEGRVSQEQQAAAYRWRELQNQMSAVELTEPEQALAAYQAFYETSGHLYVEVAVGVTSRIAQVYGRNLKNPAKAVELYAWALEQWGDTPYQDRLQREAAQMKALLAKGGTSKAAEVGVRAAPVVPFQAVGVPSVVGVPSLNVPPVVGVASVGEMPSTVGVVFSLGGSKLAVTLNEIEAGRLSAEDAWARGELSVVQVRALLEQLNPWGKVEGQIGNQTRRALARLVVGHAPQLVEVPGALSLAQRLWIGDALGDARDGRCVALLESAIDELKAHSPLRTEGEIVSAFIASERLAWFYRDAGQHEKAAQTWLGVPPLLTDAPLGEPQKWMLPDAMIEAARCYRADGQTAKAKRIYDTVPGFGVPWQTALALWDQCSVLFGQGHYKEAQLLVDQYKSDARFNLPAYVGSLIEGKIAMKQEEWSRAHDVYIQAMKEYNDLPQQSHGVKNRVFSVSIEQGLEWSQNWTKQRFFCDLRDMTAVVERDTDGVAGASWTMHIYSANPTSFKVECANPKVKIKVNEQTDFSYGYETTVSVDVDIPVSNDHVQEELRVFPSNHPNQVEKLPLFVEVK